jgi:Second Messenger Oligonucleotide or Dinucleotide Synthetase domain
MHDHFLKLKTNLELTPSFDQVVQTRHAAVQSALENTGAAIREMKLIGSLQRQTRIQPRQNDPFDINILVVLGSFYNWLASVVRSYIQRKQKIRMNNADFVTHQIGLIKASLGLV